MRPLKFQTPEDMEAVIEKYFSETAMEKITLSGLCLALRTTKETLDDYKVREGYQDIVKFAKLRIENAYEHSLREKGRSADIFAMKNFGWSDQKEMKLTGDKNSPVFVVTGMPDGDSSD